MSNTPLKINKIIFGTYMGVHVQLSCSLLVNCNLKIKENQADPHLLKRTLQDGGFFLTRMLTVYPRNPYSRNPYFGVGIPDQKPLIPTPGIPTIWC